MTTHTDNTSSYDLITALISAGVDRTMRLAHKLGYTKSVIQNRLAQMERRNLIHACVVENGNKGRPLTMWRVGPMPGGAARAARRSGPSRAYVLADEPKRIFRKEYPVVGRRDPLDVAFFGPAKPHTPRCTACGCEQGKGHLSGCIVALVAA